MPWSRAAAGRAIFCEKPISLDLAEVDRGLNAVADAGVKLQIGFNRRFDPSHKAVADAVQHGAVGDVHLCSITSRDPGPPPIEYIRVSGGMFNDMTIHDFDMARYVTGSDVVEVYARGAVRVDPAIGEAGDIDTGVVLLTHANGALTTIDNSRRAAYGYDQRVEAFGNRGQGSLGQLPRLQQRARHRGMGTGGRRSRTSSSSVMGRATSTSGLPSSTTCVSTGPSPASGADGRAPLVIGQAAHALDDREPPGPTSARSTTERKTLR